MNFLETGETPFEYTPISDEEFMRLKADAEDCLTDPQAVYDPDKLRLINLLAQTKGSPGLAGRERLQPLRLNEVDDVLDQTISRMEAANSWDFESLDLKFRLVRDIRARGAKGDSPIL